MRKKKVVLNTKHYNILLRSVVNCGVGDMTVFRRLVQENVEESLRKLGAKLAPLNALTSGEDNSIAEIDKLKQIESSESSPVIELSQMEVSETDIVQSDASESIDTENSVDTELNESVFSELTEIEADENVTSVDITEVQPNLQYLPLLTENIKDSVEVIENRIYHELADVLNPKLKFPADIHIRAANTPTARLMLLGEFYEATYNNTHILMSSTSTYMLAG